MVEKRMYQIDSGKLFYVLLQRLQFGCIMCCSWKDVKSVCRMCSFERLLAKVLCPIVFLMAYFAARKTKAPEISKERANKACTVFHFFCAWSNDTLEPTSQQTPVGSSWISSILRHEFINVSPRLSHREIMLRNTSDVMYEFISNTWML